VPADQVKAVKPPANQDIQHPQPEILKRSPTHIQGPGKSLPVSAYTIGKGWQRQRQIRYGRPNALANRPNNQIVCRQRQMIAMLLRMPNRNHHYSADIIR
jgi:hypothetical protein